MGTSQTSPGKPNFSGLDLEKTSRLWSTRNFFLDIPFDRTHGLISFADEGWKRIDLLPKSEVDVGFPNLVVR